MKCIGIVFGNRCTYWQNVVGWEFISSSMLLYRLVYQTELYFEQVLVETKYTVIILGYIFLCPQKK